MSPKPDAEPSPVKTRAMKSNGHAPSHDGQAAFVHAIQAVLEENLVERKYGLCVWMQVYGQVVKNKVLTKTSLCFFFLHTCYQKKDKNKLKPSKQSTTTATKRKQKQETNRKENEILKRLWFQCWASWANIASAVFFLLLLHQNGL